MKPHRIVMIREYTTKKGEAKKAYLDIGIAWPHKHGTGFNLEFYAFPAQMSEGAVCIFPPREEEKSRDVNEHASPLPDEPPPISDDDVPF